MEETWAPIKEFDHYSVSSEGRIRNELRRQMIRTSKTKQGAMKVGLSTPNGQATRSVKVLVAEAFVKGRTEIFNTPIHLDGDQSNCRAENLVWRPRWFAWKYARQFETISRYEGVGPIVDRKTGLVYTDIVEACLKNGILFREVEMAVVNKIPVFPTWHLFDWVVVSD